MSAFLRLLSRNRLALGGLIVLVIVVILALLTPVLPLKPPNVTDTPNRFLPPFSEGAILGTDHLGRDLLSRLMWGTRLSLAVGFAAAVIAATIGAAIGIIAGYYGGRTDNVIMRGRRHADGLSLHPAGAGHRRSTRPRADERADRGGRRQHPLLRTEHPRGHRGHRQQGIRRRGQACRHVGREDHRDRGPAQRDPGHRHRHVHHRGLDDPRDGGAVVPGPRQPAAAGRSGVHAGRGALGADHQSAHLHRAGPDDPGDRDGHQPAGRRGCATRSTRG